MKQKWETHELPRLREIRTRTGYSLRELARAAEVDKTTIQALEKGRQRAHKGTREALARALGVTEKDLMGHPEFPEAQATAYLQSLFEEEKTIYDAETENMSDAELAMHVRKNPALMRMVGAIHKAEEERQAAEREQVAG